jgi:hypothetical protein
MEDEEKTILSMNEDFLADLLKEKIINSLLQPTVFFSLVSNNFSHKLTVTVHGVFLSGPAIILPITWLFC